LQGALNPTSLKGRRATNLLPSASCLLPSKASALVKAIASVFWDIKTLSYSGGIDWRDWVEEEGEQGYFPIRLRLFEEQLFLNIGLSDWDNDHRGAIASGFVTKDMPNQEILDLCLELYQEIAYCV
jgi:hypothetical protein